MKRVIAAIAVAVMFAVAAVPAISIEVPSADSVRALAIPLPDDNGYGILRNICTVSAIGDGTKWLTAAHCVSDPRFNYYISGELIQVAGYDEANDIAILSTRRTQGEPLKIAKAGPKLGQNILILGHPLGIEDLFQSTGQVMSIAMLEDPGGNIREIVIFQATGAPGNSGSPVLNMRGEIISVVQIGWSRSFSPVLGGVSHETLVKFVGKVLGVK